VLRNFFAPLKLPTPLLPSNMPSLAFRRALERATRVVSIRDLPYPISPPTCYHPAFLKGAIKRLTDDRRYTHMNARPHLLAAIRHVLSHPAAKRTWGVLVERDGEPIFVAQNLGCDGTSLTFRRFLRVNLSALGA
jgi:hypothetical protein